AAGLGAGGLAVRVEHAGPVRVRRVEVLLVRLAADVVVAYGGHPRVLPQLVGGQEGVPLRLGVRRLDLVAAGDQQLGVRVGGRRDLDGVRPAGLVASDVAGGADLRVAVEQEVVVALEVQRPERVRRGPVAVRAHPVRVRGVLLEPGDGGVPVEATAGGDVRAAGRG